MIYLTSDTHFCHDKSFLYEPRGFSSVSEMNQAIVKNWNKTVGKDDDVYHLGDVMLNNNAEGARLLHQLNGRIHIILGNHDTDARVDIFNDSYNVVEVCYGRPLKYEGYHFFLSHYPTITSNFDHGKPLKARVINLCGHSHTSNPFQDWDKGIIYHVELDAHRNTPVSIDDCLSDIKYWYDSDDRT